MNVAELTIGEIKDRFDLETVGDAWALVIDNDWYCEQGRLADRPQTWVVEVPEGWKA